MTAQPFQAGRSDEPDLRKLRHDVRGCMHGMQLVISALETPMTKEDSAEFLGDVERAADRMADLMAKLEALPEEG